MAGREESIPAEMLRHAVTALFEEAFIGPPDPKTTWFVDNEPNAGIIGVLEGLDVAEATRQLAPPSPLTLVSHVGHLRFALSLAVRAGRGENPYPGANWRESWASRVENEQQWRELLSALRAEYLEFVKVLGAGLFWENEELLTGALAQVAHGAWHLGAIRQALGRVVPPRG